MLKNNRIMHVQDHGQLHHNLENENYPVVNLIIKSSGNLFFASHPWKTIQELCVCVWFR